MVTVPLRGSTALQSAVLALRALHLQKLKALTFFLLLSATHVTCFPRRCVLSCRHRPRHRHRYLHRPRYRRHRLVLVLVLVTVIFILVCHRPRHRHRQRHRDRHRLRHRFDDSFLAEDSVTGETTQSREAQKKTVWWSGDRGLVRFGRAAAPLAIRRPSSNACTNKVSTLSFGLT